jgi:excisionase family DNA binding protein
MANCKRRAAANGANSTPRGALKLKPAAHYLSLSVPTVHRLVKNGLLKPNRATRHLLFPVEELQRFLRQ